MLLLNYLGDLIALDYYGGFSGEVNENHPGP